MSLITLPYTFTAGATIVAAEHNSNFSTIYNDYNGNITNANIAAGAAIVDTKLAAISTAGKVNITSLTAGGTDAQGDIWYRGAAAPARLGAGTSGYFLQTQGTGANPQWASVGANKHYRKGMLLKQGSTADTDIILSPGTLEITGSIYNTTTNSSDIDVTVAGNWVHGGAGVPYIDTWVYTYASVNAGALSFVLSDEAPDLAYNDDSTSDATLRYQKYGTTYYRCLGADFIDHNGDLTWGHASSSGNYASQFDASNINIICGIGTGVDQTIKTLWTPKYVKVIFAVDTGNTPGVGNDIRVQEATNLMLDTNWYATQLNAGHDNSAGNHEWWGVVSTGTVKTFTSQSAGVSGSYTITGMDGGYHFYALAMTDDL